MAVIVKESLTFDDVLLVPGHSTVHPKDTPVRTATPKPPAAPHTVPSYSTGWAKTPGGYFIGASFSGPPMAPIASGASAAAFAIGAGGSGAPGTREQGQKTRSCLRNIDNPRRSIPIEARQR